jgi:hypothetical protein
MRQTKNIAEAAAARRPWWRPGPATLFALVVGAGIVWWQMPRPSESATGRLAYEADASGHLRRVDSPALFPGSQPAAPALWKPEVPLLLARGQELRLTASQGEAIHRLEADWRAEKADWQRRLGDASGKADALLQRPTPEHGASLTAVRSGLEDYSRLSEEYDRRRAGYWMQATALLTSTQRQQLDQIRLTLTPKSGGGLR